MISGSLANVHQGIESYFNKKKCGGDNPFIGQISFSTFSSITRIIRLYKYMQVFLAVQKGAISIKEFGEIGSRRSEASYRFCSIPQEIIVWRKL